MKERIVIIFKGILLFIFIGFYPVLLFKSLKKELTGMLDVIGTITEGITLTTGMVVVFLWVFNKLTKD